MGIDKYNDEASKAGMKVLTLHTQSLPRLGFWSMK
jgi:hypothetical protein